MGRLEVVVALCCVSALACGRGCGCAVIGSAPSGAANGVWAGQDVCMCAPSVRVDAAGVRTSLPLFAKAESDQPGMLGASGSIVSTKDAPSKSSVSLWMGLPMTRGVERDAEAGWA